MNQIIPTKIETKADIKPNFENSNGPWLNAARAIAIGIIRQHGSATAEDVRKLCPPPPDAHPNVMGALFKDIRFEPIGFEEARRKTSKGRIIRRYKLREKFNG